MRTQALRHHFTSAVLAAALFTTLPGQLFAEKKTVQPPSGSAGLAEDSAAGAVVKSALGGKTMVKEKPTAINGEQLNANALNASAAQTKADRQAQNIDQTMQTAFIKLDRGDCLGALSNSAEVIAMDAKMAAAHIAHGDANYCLKNYTDAARDATTALSIEPENDNALTLRSRAYRQMQDYKRAYADLVSIRDRQPSDARLWSESAKLAEAAGDPAAALEAYKTAATLEPSKYEPVLQEYQNKANRKTNAAAAPAFKRPQEEGLPGWLVLTGVACAGILLLLALMLVMKKAMS